MRKLLSLSRALRTGVLIVATISPAPFLSAQILMSGGTYSQNFDSLASSGTPPWTDNSTLPGWYASTNAQSASIYRTGSGTSATSGIYSFGANSSTDRALGCLASGSTGNIAFGLRFTNDTASVQSNIVISFTAEQWRNSGNTLAQTLAFSYRVGTLLTNADGANALTWTNFPALDFTTPVTGGTSGALDGTAQENQTIFTNVALSGVTVPAGQELFLRWYFAKTPTGSSHGVAIDYLAVAFNSTNLPPTNAPALTSQPISQATGKNGLAIFSVTANGNPTPGYQWRFNGTNLPGATGATLSLNNVSTNQAGIYQVIATNVAGAATSSPAMLMVTPVSFDATNGGIRYLTYNVNGNGVADWSTNAAQVQAIGRELIYFNPDIVTFNEIPYTNTWQMANWIKAYFPGFFLATNSATDGYIRKVVVSRWPILRSQSWLGNSSLTNFGYDGRYPRDLFEAQIAVSNWPLPLHVFVAHLKATTTSPQDDADERAAQCNSISNFLVNTFLAGTNGTHPYVLSGDLNEDVFFPDTDYSTGKPVQRLVTAPTGLYLTTPVNPFNNSPSNAFTESIRGTLDTRFDYILPCAMLFSNITGMEVFRTDLLTNFPPNLYSNDDKIASDHLPVLMVFKNPFNTPFRLLSIARTNQSITLKWESQNNRNYSIETSTDLVWWTPFVTNLLTTNTNTPFVFATNNVGDAMKFFRIYRAP